MGNVVGSLADFWRRTSQPRILLLFVLGEDALAFVLGCRAVRLHARL